MKKNAFIILLALCSSIYSQEQRLLSFDLTTGVVDTLEIVEFDIDIQNESTNFNIGKFNNNFCTLYDTPPTENIFPNSNFTRKRQASLDFDINSFPLRTSIKVFKCENDSIKNSCTGIMISRKHVLTTAHCVANLHENTLSNDSIFICPAYDNGLSNPNFECSWVKKVFFFENWNITQTDFAVLELELPIGEETGWVSIGFDANDTSLLNGIFYKFSYPTETIPGLDQNSYNGDTLYYNYGIVDLAGEHFLGISNTSGITGESGSPLIKVVNNDFYTTYGVLTFAANLRHSRFTNWKYYAFKSVIENDLEVKDQIVFDSIDISVYPNPTYDYLNIVSQTNQAISKIALFDANGRKIIENTYSSSQIRLDLSKLPQGLYILTTYTEKNRIVKKIIKYD